MTQWPLEFSSNWNNPSCSAVGGSVNDPTASGILFQAGTSTQIQLLEAGQQPNGLRNLCQPGTPGELQLLEASQ